MNVLVYLFIVCADPGAAASQANKEEVDSRSVFVGNVSYMLPIFFCSWRGSLDDY
jgi:hypothetical protein